MSKLINETGNQYGMWTVLSLDKERPQNSHAYWWCQCACGAIRSIGGVSLRQGCSNGCRNCGQIIKLIYNLLNIPKNRNLKWVGEYLPLTTHEKTEWKCNICENTWEANYNGVRGCPHCYGTFPKKPEDYHTLAKVRDFKWRGPEVPNTKTKTEWECKNGHTWWAKYTYIQQEKGCPHCYGHFPKPPEDYHTQAKTRNLLWLGPEVPNVYAKTEWQCGGCGHLFWANYSLLFHHPGGGCPECNDRSFFREGYVYLALGYGDKLDGAYKIGHARNPKRRNGTFKREYPVDRTEIICTIKTSNMRKLEKEGLHPRYKDYRVEGEKEWFTLPEREVGYIKMLAERELVEAEDIGRL